MLKSPVASSSATTSTKIQRVRRTIKFKPNLATAKPPRPHFVAALVNAENQISAAASVAASVAASSAALEVVEDLPSIHELVKNNYGVEDVYYKVQEDYFD
jgi:hypothetical protein